MRTIKLHLEIEEFEPVNRLALELGVHPEEIAYAGLSHLMKHIGEAPVRDEIKEVRDSRKNSLPAWADHAHEVHAYESM